MEVTLGVVGTFSDIHASEGNLGQRRQGLEEG